LHSFNGDPLRTFLPNVSLSASHGRMLTSSFVKIRHLYLNSLQGDTDADADTTTPKVWTECNRSTIINMASVRNLEVIFDKFNLVGICNSLNYKEKLITKPYE